MTTNSFLGRRLPRPNLRSSRTTLALAVAILATGRAAAASPEQLGTADIHYAADTQVVTVKTPFGDPPVGSLTAVHPDSFIVYENGRRQDNVSVAVEHPPISIGMLLEYGGRYHALNEILGQNVSNAAKELLKQIRPDDSVAVWKYADSVEPVSDAVQTADGPQGNAFSLPTPPFSELNFRDSLISTLPKIQAMSGHRVLVVLSTGIDTFSKASFADVLAATRRAGVQIYVINLGPLVQSDMPPYLIGKLPYASLNWNLAGSRLATLARASGGQMYSPESLFDLTAVYDELMAELRTRYVIQYKSHSAAAPDQPRTVRIEDRRARLVAKVRYIPAHGTAGA